MENAALIMAGIPRAAEAWEDFDSRRNCFAGLGSLLQQAIDTGEIKNKDLMPRWKEVVAWNIPGVDPKPATDQINIQNIHGIRERLSNAQTITKADLDDLQLLVKQYQAIWVAAQKGHAMLDQVLTLLRQIDTFSIACQTTPHSFDGKGVTALDRSPEARALRTQYAMDMAAADDAHWSKEIDKRTKEIVDELDRIQRRKYEWNATAFERKMVPKTMPLVWRHEIRKRIFDEQGVQSVDLANHIPGQPNQQGYAPLQFWKFDIDKDLNITEKKTE